MRVALVMVVVALAASACREGERDDSGAGAIAALQTIATTGEGRMETILIRDADAGDASRDLSLWARNVMDGFADDTELLDLKCYRVAPLAEPHEASLIELARNINAFCGEVAADPDARSADEWAAIILDELQVPED